MELAGAEKAPKDVPRMGRFVSLRRKWTGRIGFRRRGIGALIFIILGPFLFLGGENRAFSFEKEVPEQAAVLSKHEFTLQLVTGSLFSAHFLINGTPTTKYWQTNLRLGWILNDRDLEESFLAGAFEAILEITHSAIYHGPGNYLAGLTGLIRYNFLQPGWKTVPYVQIGAGAVYNDIYKDETQDAVGRSIEFTPQASVGVRYFLEDNWSLDGEVMYQHISNGNLSTRNGGINSFGGFVGLTYLFGRPGKN
jgi:lipid A 3-O-deacylase